MKLSQKKCGPCQGGVPPLTPDQIEPYLKQVGPRWKVVDGKRIQREYVFDDFAEAMKFVNKVANVAEQEGHHPDFHVHWSKVLLELWTHEIGGLAENDFIMASKIEDLV